MTEQRSPLDQVLDLLVYAPVGLALAVRDELPRLVERGKSQTDSQVALARMLGQMAAGKGQQEIAKMLNAKRFNEVWGRISGTTGAAGERPPPTEQAAEPKAEPKDEPKDEPKGKAKPKPARSAAPSPSSSPSGGPSAGDLAIPGYDALSAPQVVQRLSGLSAEELEAVGAYEEATRHRQTILGRIAQLKSGA